MTTSAILPRMSKYRFSRSASSLRVLLVLLATAVATAADAPAGRWHCAATPPSIVTSVTGRVLILPGVGNTRFHLAGFVTSVEQQLPRFDVEVRTWGLPFLTIHNLRAHERNLATAASIAADIATWRRAHPDEPFYLVGYSGGGGMATLVVAKLPHDVAIDRLILVAPAIAPDFPLVAEVLPQVREFIANFASERDLQVGWGTRTFGTIDRQYTLSAGATGFAVAHPRLLEYRWSPADRSYGHAGNHLAYLGRRWQAAKLLPALDPRASGAELAAHWAETCQES